MGKRRRGHGGGRGRGRRGLECDIVCRWIALGVPPSLHLYTRYIYCGYMIDGRAIPVPASSNLTGARSMPTVKSVGARGMTRRGLVGAALAVGVGVPLGIAGRATAATADSGPVRLTLPRPTGPYRVGVVPLHLVDRSRPEPLAGPGRYRELMVSVWYPARNERRYPRSPWMTAASMRMLLELRRLRPARRAGAVDGRARGRPGAAFGSAVAGGAVLARRRQPPFGHHNRGAGTRQPRVRGGHGGPHVRRVQRIPRRPSHRPGGRRRFHPVDLHPGRPIRPRSDLRPRRRAATPTSTTRRCRPGWALPST